VGALIRRKEGNVLISLIEGGGIIKIMCRKRCPNEKKEKNVVNRRVEESGITRRTEGSSITMRTGSM
jgi:hypothetical protein